MPEPARDSSMRLFVAVLPPPEALAALRTVIETLPTPDGLRWTPFEQWHLTLAFLGEVPQRRLEDLTARLERAARRYPRFELALTGGGRFGDRVLWAGVQGDREVLRRLAGSVRAAARRSGIAQEEGSYRPHLTLARAKPGTDLRAPVAELTAFDGKPWPVTEINLVRSRLGAAPGNRALHETIGTWPLT